MVDIVFIVYWVSHLASLFVSLYNPNLYKSIKLDPVLAMQKVAGRVNGKANSHAETRMV